ncbi:hypothetical protein [Rosistilla oblonga]|uniref:hypothetical protein n=1 Tax=Rosistilla oblonga TaxID=2527990 RepID=UPI003A980388
MISERTFVSLHRDFWRAVMPRSEHMTRLLNASRTTLLPAYDGRSNSDNRGLINEAATRLTQSALIQHCSISTLPADRKELVFSEAMQFIERFRTGQDYHIDSLDKDEIDECNEIAERLLEMFRLIEVAPEMFVRVPGAGIIDACDVDAATTDTVFEIKAGNRNCRSEDIRQALVYAALLELSGQINQVRVVEVLNPRLGWRVSSNIDSLLEMSGGRDWASFRVEFENYIVETRHSHQVIDQIIKPGGGMR